MRLLMRLGALCFLALTFGATSSFASPLSTGLGTVGGSEPNWTITTDSAGDLTIPFTPIIVDGALDYPNAWYDTSAHGLDANWITPYADGTKAIDSPVGRSDASYTYHLEFADPGRDVAISWSSDNGAAFLLNGATLDTIGDTSYGSLSTFIILASDFIGGTNIFDVVVTNIGFSGSNPTGLLVSASVPLPAALSLLATAIGGLGAFGVGRRRRNS